MMKRALYRAGIAARFSILALAFTAAACAPGAPATPTPRPLLPHRSIILMLDGVPYAMVDSLYRAGHFKAFQPPSVLISTFPSLTAVSFRDIWRAPLRPGYEDKYYDPEQNRVTGGALEHFLGGHGDPTFHDNVDIEANGLLVGLIYVFPGLLSSLELRDFRKEVLERAETDSTVVGYLVSTDAIAHRSGRDAVVKAVLRVEALTEELLRRYPDARITLFSDHGNDLVPTKRVDLDRAIRAAALNPAKELNGERDVVLPKFGLVGSAFLYSTPALRTHLAQALAAEEGVELVLFTDELDRVQVWSRNGRARVEAGTRPGTYRYIAVQGDPLHLSAAADSFATRGLTDPDGAAADSLWLRASLATPYIDSVRRIWIGMHAAVKNPAGVIVSFAPGYHYGDPMASRFVKVSGTHGSLRTSSSAAFLLTNGERPPSLIRSDSVFPILEKR